MAAPRPRRLSAGGPQREGSGDDGDGRAAGYYSPNPAAVPRGRRGSVSGPGGFPTNAAVGATSRRLSGGANGGANGGQGQGAGPGQRGPADAGAGTGLVGGVLKKLHIGNPFSESTKQLHKIEASAAARAAIYERRGPPGMGGGGGVSQLGAFDDGIVDFDRLDMGMVDRNEGARPTDTFTAQPDAGIPGNEELAGDWHYEPPVRVSHAGVMVRATTRGPGGGEEAATTGARGADGLPLQQGAAGGGAQGGAKPATAAGGGQAGGGGAAAAPSKGGEKGKGQDGDGEEEDDEDEDEFKFVRKTLPKGAFSHEEVRAEFRCVDYSPCVNIRPVDLEQQLRPIKAGRKIRMFICITVRVCWRGNWASAARRFVSYVSKWATDVVAHAPF
jgi:hypothetical protein